MSLFSQEFWSYDFVKLAKSCHNPREQMRLLAFVHLKEGKTVKEVAAIVKVSRNAVYVWLRRFRNKSIEGLKEIGGRGAKSKLPLSEHEAFRQAVLRLQEARSGGRIKGSDILELMEIKFGITCTKRSVYNHLKRANLVWVSARAKHPKGDLAKQEVFKKNLKLK